MRRVIAFVGLSGLIVVATARGAHHIAALTTSGPVGQSSQLELPASAFPADYTAAADEAWTASTADGSTFSKMHGSSYTALGILGAWYQYYAKQLSMTSGGVMLVGPVEVAYLGTYYPDAASAAAAYSDVQPSPILSNPQTCSYGTRCVTYHISLQWNGPTYTGLARIIQLGNAVAEIRTDVFDQMSSAVSMDQLTSNLDGVSQAFVQDLNTLSPTNTPVPPTAILTSTPTNTPTATPSPTATSTSTVVPVSVDVVSVRAESYGSKVDTGLTRPPLKKVKVGTRVYLSIYLQILSAPPGTVGTADFRLTLLGRPVLHRAKQVEWSSPGTERSTVTFKPTKPGNYRFRGMVTVNGITKQRSATLRVVM